MHSSKLHACAAICFCCLLAAIAFAQEWNYPPAQPGSDTKDISFYKASDTEYAAGPRTGRPRNVIVLIGDGMGINHVALARHRAVGAAGRLHMERLPVFGLVRTYSADNPVTDSAAAATAMACGIKTSNGKIGVAPDGTAYDSILERLGKKGWRTGLVATSSITHATPAGFAAHSSKRSAETDIAADLLNARVDVLFGGGRKYWIGPPAGVRDDGRNLIAEAAAAGYQIIYSGSQLTSLKPACVLGLFAEEGMMTFPPEPSLAQMTQTAVGLLSSPAGEWFAPRPRFFLMVEGSQIDWAAHNNDADNCIRQTLLFDLAVKEAMDFAQRNRDTLVIVTADHETGGLILRTTKEKQLRAYWTSKDHTAADVPIYSFGPGSQRFSGMMNNTDIPKRIAELVGIRDFPSVKLSVEQKTAVPMQ
ncbi:MAG TPA: alkaline phosphatase [Anaerohalosphaeraceae bacterium]|nr:alkaline phosphatase [Phycisphaerae bacterium]HPC64827.1 alkaline phosphatase [Anaerohalosphaeraceae bacterium]